MARAGQLFRAAMRVCPLLPPAIAYRLCDDLGIFAPLLPAYPAILANLRQVRPAAGHATLAALARGVVVNLLKNYYDLLRAHTLSNDQLAALFTVEGLANAKHAFAAGRGAVVVSLHTGNFSLPFEPLARALGVEILLVVEQLRDPVAHAIVNGLRQREHVTVAPVDDTITRRILQTLHRGGAVILAQDRLVAGASRSVTFFGAPADLPSGPALLALRTGAPLLPVYVARRPDNRSRVVIDPPILPHGVRAREGAVQWTTQALVRVLEGYIAADPSQWVLTNRVWAARQDR